MEHIDFELKANNSSGNQTLELVKDGDEFWFVLVGEYNGEKIQIDFDGMTRDELESLRVGIQLILEAP